MVTLGAELQRSMNDVNDCPQPVLHTQHNLSVQSCFSQVMATIGAELQRSSNDVNDCPQPILTVSPYGHINPRR